MRVAEAAIAAGRDDGALPRFHEVGEQRFIILGEHLRSRRNLQHGVLAGCARAYRAHAVLAVAGLEMLLIPEVDKRIQVRDALDQVIPAAPATVSAIRAAELNELLAPEGKAAIPAISRANVNFCLI